MSGWPASLPWLGYLRNARAGKKVARRLGGCLLGLVESNGGMRGVLGAVSRMIRPFSAAVLSATLFIFSACSASYAPGLPPAGGRANVQTMLDSGAGKIKHIVWIVQEN